MSDPKKKNPMVALITGSISGGIEAVAVWPTENIKTQLQLQGKVANPKFTSFSGGVKYILGTQGVRGLYTGLAPILVGSLPKAGIRFGSQAWFSDKIKGMNLPVHTSIVSLLSGMCAGASEAVFAVTPMETVKTKTIEMNVGFVEGTKRIVQSSGLGGLYQGLASTIMKQASNQGMRFFFMGFYRDWVTDNGEKKIKPLESLAGGMGAGCFSTLGNNPIDVVKTKMQGMESTKYKGTVDCFAQTFRNEGIAGFYSGVVPRLYRVVPGQGIIFMTFDIISPMVEMALGGETRMVA